MNSPRLMIGRRMAVLAAAVLWLPAMSDAQVAAQPAGRGAGAAADGDKFVLRTYWVGDLILDVPDYPYAGGSARPQRGTTGTNSGGGGGVFAVPDEPSMRLMQFGGRGGGLGGGSGGLGDGGFSSADGQDANSQPARITMDDLIDAMTSTVASDSWAESGGEGEVRPVGNALVVWQSVAAHEQIAELLRQLRDVVEQRHTITIDARWLLLNSDDIERLRPADSAERPGLDRKRLAELTRQPSSIRGQTTCLSGQLVYIVSGTRRNFVSGYIPVVGSLDDQQQAGVRFAALRGGARLRLVAEDSALANRKESRVGYQPIVEQPNFGALLEIRPTLMRDNNSAIVDLRSTLTVPSGRSGELAERSEPAPAPPVVDRITLDAQEFATTLRVSIGEPVLVGGLTYVPPSIESLRDAALRQPQEEALENPQYYLILEVR